MKLADIATRTGFGVTTVSEILNNTTRRTYPEDTRRRVLDAAESLGYRANSSARATRSGRFNAAAVVSSSDPRYSWCTHAMLAALEVELRRHDQHLIFTALDEVQLTAEQRQPKVLSELLVDGILLNYTHQTPQPLIDQVEAGRVPVVWLNTIREHDCVFADNRRGFEQATRRIIELGHRQIGYVGCLPQEPTQDLHFSTMARYAGYEQAMCDAGLGPHLISPIPADGSSSPLYDALRSDDRPTALLCYQVDEAAKVLYAAVRAGLRVPEDLTVVTMASEGETVGPVPLTRLQVCEAERATKAVDLLNAKIDRPGVRLAPQSVPLHMIDEAASLRPIRSTRSRSNP